jgi:ATP-binding cassette subfamily B protein
MSKSLEMRTTRRDLFAKLCTVFGYSMVIGLLAFEFSSGRISAGLFGAAFASLKEMYSLMDEVVSSHIGELARNFGGVHGLIELMDGSCDSVKQKGPKSYSTMALNNVCYAYPNQQNYAVTDINVTIKRGQIVALVGENGAGKSTLARLLVGMYKQTCGDIYYAEDKNGKAALTAAFQKFGKYNLTLYENIKIGDTESEDDMENILSIFEPTLLDESQQLLLGTEFGGVDLSRGQWQSLALSRAFYRSATVVLLDEPTSALDPLKEDRIFEAFRRLLDGKTAIVVTHSMASIRFADLILVLKSGKIIESGSHQELMHLNGVYKAMVSEQALQYE